MNKQLMIRLCLFFLLFCELACAEALRLSVNAESAILINAATGKILFEKNSHQAMYPASITKVATALYALKTYGNRINELVTVEHEAVATTTAEAKKKANYTLPPYWLEPDGTQIGLKKGEQMTIKDLLYGMLIASGNDASNAIALHLAGSITDFMGGLNKFLKQIGCNESNFANPHGLFHPQQQTTAFDMALMTKHALQIPLFCHIVSTVNYPRPKTTKQDSTILVQTNKLLKKGKHYYSKAIGVKTGHLSIAGNNLVAAARHEERTLIAVLLKTKDRSEMFNDAIKLFETAFNQKKVERTLLKRGTQQFVLDLPGAAKQVTSFLSEDVKVAYYPAEEPDIKCLLYWDQLQPPIKKNQKIGELHFFDEKETILTVPLQSQEEIPPTFTFAIKNFIASFWYNYRYIFIFTVCLILFLFALIIRNLI